MNDMYIYYLKKYLEKLTNLESHLLFLQDKYGLMNGIEDIELYLYPHKVILIDENVTFRAKYEDIKGNKNRKYILILRNEEIQSKLLDFIKRSEEGKVKEITIQALLECVEEDLKWNERINEFDSSDLKNKFKELIYYRKLFRKKNIEKHEVDKIVLSTLLDLDATQINDEVDCYLYYRDIKDIYGDFDNLKYKTNVKELLHSVFSECGSFIANVIELSIFEEFDRLIWICRGLNDFNRLSKENIRIILKDEYGKLEEFDSHLEELVNFTNLINKKDKKYYIQKKDWAEKLILNAKIDVISNEHSYKEMLHEGKVSLINILESIRAVLKDYNLEGLKKVYKYSLDNLYELQVLIDESISYKTENMKSLIHLYTLIIELCKKIEYAEKQIKFVNTLSSYSDWEMFYKNHLYDLQYRLSEIRYLDRQDMIEKQRYPMIDKRISNILNQYRKHFAKFLEANYNSWKQSPYGISRPVLNSDIHTMLDLDNQKTFVIVFDGMRYDAWEYIVRSYFKKVFTGRNVKYKSSFALLPTITSISREAIYSDIIKKYKEDTIYLTKSESFKNENQLKENILCDKRINVLVFNMFDKDGHKATEDFYIFYDKQRKVFENSITELLKMIPEDANVIITSDHGLMRLDKYVNMKDIENTVNIKTRHLKVNNNLDLEGFIKIQNIKESDSFETLLLSYENKGYFVGGGEKDLYSHGGASLEEVIVPFIIAEGKSVKKETYYKKAKKLEKLAQSEILELDKDTILRLSVKLNTKEKIILTSLYNFKNQKISNRDIEKILIRKVGSAGLVKAMINRLMKKLKKDGLDIIEESAVGDLIMYKFNHDGLKGDI